MNKILVTFASLAMLFASCHGTNGQTSDFELINKIPWNSGFDFRSEDMIRVVNHLRHLGKDKALQVLNNYVQKARPSTPENVILICRVLFVNTNGWTIQLPGTPLTPFDRNAGTKFPLFPIVLSHGIPFQVVEGYRRDGPFGNRPAECVEYCKGLQMIPSDLTSTNYEAAAQELIRSKEFHELYKDPSDEAWITFMIQRQTGNTNELINKIPWNSGFDFRSEDMIRVVNNLRHLGKDKALQALNIYVQKVGPIDSGNVILICRVLFVNTNSWTIQLPGSPMTQFDRNASTKFPLFPIVLSQGIPFQFVDGYRLGGPSGNLPAECVEYCKGLRMIPSDLTSTNYEAAALELIRSKEFHELYKDPSDEAWITFMIQRQTGNTNEYVELPNGKRRIVPFEKNGNH